MHIFLRNDQKNEYRGRNISMADDTTHFDGWLHTYAAENEAMDANNSTFVATHMGIAFPSASYPHTTRTFRVG